ncbi:MAG TPA: hypothetical protein VJR29_00930 [bacterium]|nr:hypothetical protein [bacterium]
MEGARQICTGLLSQAAWAPSTRRALEALSREKDSELLGEGLLHLAGREEKAGREAKALAIYEAIATRGARGFSPALPTAIGEAGLKPLATNPIIARALRRREALLGRGNFGDRAEVLAGHFFREATEPSSLIAMAGAQAVYGLTRGALLFRLLSAPESALTRGFAAKSLASLGGFALEAPAFVALGRGARRALGRNFPEPGFGQELATSYISLGMLKVGGATARSITAGLGARVPLPRLIQDGAMLGGLMAAHGLEARWGLRAAGSFDDSLLDSVVTLLQLKVGGRVLSSALGEAHATRQRELEFRIQSAAPRFRRFAGARAAAFAGGPGVPILMMESFDDTGSSSAPRQAPAASAPLPTFILDRIAEIRVPEDCSRLAIEIYDRSYTHTSSRSQMLDIEIRMDRIFQGHPWLQNAEVRLMDGSKLVYHRRPQQAPPSPAARSHELSLHGYWRPPARLGPLPQHLRNLRESYRLSPSQVAERVAKLTGEAKEAKTILTYERSSAQAIPLKTLRALAEIYQADIRDLIAASNRTRFPKIEEKAWTTESYPIYLEDKSDLRRLEHFARRDPRRNSFGWLVFSRRKDPFRYFYTRDFREAVGMESGLVDAEENRRYPSWQAVQGLARTLRFRPQELIDAANRTFYPELDMAALFPGQSLHLDLNSKDADLVRTYAKNPGTLGQTLFGYRKGQAEPIGANELSQREGFSTQHWREAEQGLHEPNDRTWQDWYRFLKARGLSTGPVRPWLETLDRYQENAAEAGRRLGPWTPRATALPLPARLRKLREDAGLGRSAVAAMVTEMTGEPCLWTGIRDYEESTPKMSFKVLRALAEIYRADVRDLVVDSNRGRFPDLEERLWLLPRYPIYLERDSDVERLRFHAGSAAGRRGLGWKIFAARKNPLGYQNLADLEARTGIGVKALGRLETNQDYPTPRVLSLLSEALEIPQAQLIEAANRTFHPEFDWKRIRFGRSFYLQPHSQDARKLALYLAQPGSLGQILFEYRKGQPGHPSVGEMAQRFGTTEAWWNERELNEVGITSRNRWRWEEVLDREPKLKNRIFGTSR